MLRTVTRSFSRGSTGCFPTGRVEEWGLNMSRAGPGVGSLPGKGRGPRPGSLYGEGVGLGVPCG